MAQKYQNNKNVLKVSDEIKRGQRKTSKTFLRSCPHEITEKCPLIKPMFKEKKYPPFRIYKTYYVTEKREKPKPCKHSGNFVIPREVLTKNEYISLLAQPKVRKDEKPTGRFITVSKIIPPCTSRISRLALPKKQKVYATWQEHSHHLPAERIEIFRNALVYNDFLTISEAEKTIQQQKQFENQKKKSVKKEIRKMKNKILKKEMKEIERVMREIYQVMKPFLLSAQSISHTPKTAAMSDAILEMICKSQKYKIPNRKYCDETNDKYMIELADKLALWLADYLCGKGVVGKNKGFKADKELCEFVSKDYENNERAAKDGNKGYPIDDYILWSAACEQIRQEKEQEDILCDNLYESKWGEDNDGEEEDEEYDGEEEDEEYSREEDEEYDRGEEDEEHENEDYPDENKKVAEVIRIEEKETEQENEIVKKEEKKELESEKEQQEEDAEDIKLISENEVIRVDLVENKDNTIEE